jgi:hypothetical protein
MIWNLFPVTALLSFAAWVALMAATGDPAAVVLFVSVFLAAVWWAQCRYYEVNGEVDDAIARLQQSGELPDWER